MKILIVDDEEAIRRPIVRYLTSLGFKVMEAENGKQGLNLIELETFNLIITDIVMPEIEGVEFIHRVKQIDNNIPIIVMSGNEFGRSSFEIAEEFGAIKSFVKPINLKEFGEEIKKILSE